MPEKFQAPTEFIAGLNDLGMGFKKLPRDIGVGYAVNGRTILHHLHQALGWVAEVPYPEPVHVPGTPLFQRHLLSLERLPDPEEAPGYAMCAAVHLAVEEKEENTVFKGMFSVETMALRTKEGARAGFTPLTFGDAAGQELEDPRDINVALTILKAAVRKPARRLRKDVTGYLVGGRIWD